MHVSALTAQERGWPVTDGGLVFEEGQAMRWLGDYIKVNGLRTTDKMHVQQDKKLWALLRLDCSQDKLHLEQLSRLFRTHLLEMPSAGQTGSSTGSVKASETASPVLNEDMDDEDSDGEDEDEDEDVGIECENDAEESLQEDTQRRELDDNLISLDSSSSDDDGKDLRTYLLMRSAKAKRAEQATLSAEMSTQPANVSRESPPVPCATEQSAAPLSATSSNPLRTAANQALSDTPDEFKCPITTEIMLDPVIAMDGHTYEREAIELWLGLHRTSPMTNEEMPSNAVVPNRNLKKLIQASLPNIMSSRH